MPEVVEVCITSLWLNHELKDSILSDIKILKGRYSRHPLPGLNLFKKANNYKIIKIESKGKFMWFELKDKNGKTLYILNKYGLTGEWGFTEKDYSGVEFTIKNKNTTDNKKLFFTDFRNFGTLEITDKISRLNKELNKIAPDFLKVSFTNNEFHKRVVDYCSTDARKKREIIKVLMDQTVKNSIGSGLGNYLSVSALYMAKISPYTSMEKIAKSKVLSNRLSESIKYIVKLAFLTSDTGYFLDLDKGIEKFLKTLRSNIFKNNKHIYNFHPDIKIKKGDKFKFEVYGQDKDPYGNDVVGDKIIPGRTTYWVPAIQK